MEELHAAHSAKTGLSKKGLEIALQKLV